VLDAPDGASAGTRYQSTLKRIGEVKP
jgi:hypothetical protein